MDPLALVEAVGAPALVGVPLLAALVGLVAVKGHANTLKTLMVGSTLALVGSVFFVLEIIYLACTPFRVLMRAVGPPPVSADEAAALAAGKVDLDKRRIVVFDGVCVLCNGAGRFVVRHLPDPNLVSFVPFQDALANPHVSLAKLQQEFPDLQPQQLTERIGIVSGRKMYWGAEAVMEVCSWMYFPFPLLKLGYIIPRPIRDFVYSVVSSNRYDWFGTQPLERNFAKNLCPYLAVKKYLEVRPADAASSSEGLKRE